MRFHSFLRPTVMSFHDQICIAASSSMKKENIVCQSESIFVMIIFPFLRFSILHFVAALLHYHTLSCLLQSCISLLTCHHRPLLCLAYSVLFARVDSGDTVHTDCLGQRTHHDVSRVAERERPCLVPLRADDGGVVVLGHVRRLSPFTSFFAL